MSSLLVDPTLIGERVETMVHHEFPNIQAGWKGTIRAVYLKDRANVWFLIQWDNTTLWQVFSGAVKVLPKESK